MAKELIKSDATIKAAKPQAAPYRLSDGSGLYLLVRPDGKKWWRLDYTHEGKRKTLSLGTYPDTGLALARTKAAAERELVAAGIDPSEARQSKRTQRAEAQEIERRLAEGVPLADSFEAIGREWFDKFSPGWVAGHGDKIIRRLERDIFPWLGARPIAEIKAPELLSALRRIEDRSAIETAHRALQNCGQVFRYAIATGRAERDISADLRGALVPVSKTHLPAITDPKAIGGLLRAIDGYTGFFVTKCALRIAPLVFVRPGELRKAEWSEIDLDNAEWTIPAERMKMRQPHLVPLSRQAVEILRELHAVTGRGQFVFPGARANGRPMSDNAVLAALRRMGIPKEEMTGHGFRAMARTVLDEVLGFRPDWIEHQLAHAVRDPNGRAYNRTAHLTKRREMMQAWADYLDALKAENVVPFKAKKA
ncbi:MAG: integrase arm-type DNA-binding domain-containing protein [Betaproteobacteria bacterium]|nr:integrase arm-type DNA-binding domain-containing protein [Betaproteobacteria bacterium]